MSLFTGFYIVSLLALFQLVGLIFIVRAINRLCDEVSSSRTRIMAVDMSPGAATATETTPRKKPSGVCA